MPSKIPKKTKFQLKVKKSNAGLGLFTEESIPRGEFIIEYFGPRLSNKQANERGGKYLFEAQDGVVIDGSSRENLARYINHSCKPNSKAYSEGKRVMVYSKRKIEAGEEITCHYGKEYFESIIKPQGCKCGHH